MQMETKQIRKIFSRVGLGITALVVVQQIGIVILSTLLALMAPALLEAEWITWPLLYIPLYCMGFPVMLAVFKTIPNFAGGPPEKKRISLLGILALTSTCLFITLALNSAMYYLAALIEQIKGAEVANALGEVALNTNPWFNFLAVGIVAPLMEELIFRKKLHDKLIVFGGKVYILVSAFIFAMFHANFYQLLYAFVLGIILATVMYQTGTIKYTIAVHMLLNIMGSGGSTLLLYYAGEEIYLIWNYLLTAVAVIGLVAMVWWLLRRRKSVELAPAEVPLPSKGIVFANPGMIIFTVVFVALTLMAILV